MDELPPLPWRISRWGYRPDLSCCDIFGSNGRLVAPAIKVSLGEHIIRAIPATADPDILALAEHLAAMDQGQRGAAMDQIKHAIGGEW